MCITRVPDAYEIQKRASGLKLELWMGLNVEFYYLVNITNLYTN